MSANIRETLAVTHENEVPDFSGMTERVHPIVEGSVVQTAPGPAPKSLTIFSSHQATLIGISPQSPSVGVVVLRPEYCGFMWWQGQTEARVNGVPAQFTHLYAQGEQNGFHTVGGKRATMGIAIDRRSFVETVAALRGVSPEDVHLKQSVLQLSTAAAIRFRSNIDWHIQNALKPKTGKTENTDAGESIVGLVVDAFLHSSPVKLRHDGAEPPERIVRKAEERFFAAGERPISLADLCLATGVSQSTLYRAFNQVCGAPPLAYFHKRRLSNARRKLVGSPAVRGAVKQIALGAGLTELGRFSVEYRRLFGESPSTTLNSRA